MRVQGVASSELRTWSLGHFPAASAPPSGKHDLRALPMLSDRSRAGVVTDRRIGVAAHFGARALSVDFGHSTRSGR